MYNIKYDYQNDMTLQKNIQLIYYLINIVLGKKVFAPANFSLPTTLLGREENIIDTEEQVKKHPDNS